MGRADDLRALQEAEYTVVELEDELLLEKQQDGESDDYRQTKLALRGARRRYRELRAGGEVAEGDAAPEPAPVKTRAKAKGV